MEEKFVKLGKSNVLTLKIKTDEGKDTGEVLQFQLDDIELPLKYQELIERDKKNRINLQNKLTIIDKKEDVKGNGLLSRNEEEKLKAMNDFFKEETEIYNIFLGERGVEKLLNGRKLGWTSLQEIDEIIEKQIEPQLNVNMKTITDKIKEKYGKLKEQEEIEVLE